jgi:hypothetical protein
MTQIIPALPGAILGRPLGLGLLKVVSRPRLSGLPPLLWLVAAVLPSQGGANRSRFAWLASHSSARS